MYDDLIIDKLKKTKKAVRNKICPNCGSMNISPAYDINCVETTMVCMICGAKWYVSKVDIDTGGLV